LSKEIRELKLQVKYLKDASSAKEQDLGILTKRNAVLESEKHDLITQA
jgi:hypothetical protein